MKNQTIVNTKLLKKCINHVNGLPLLAIETGIAVSTLTLIVRGSHVPSLPLRKLISIKLNQDENKLFPTVEREI